MTANQTHSADRILEYITDYINRVKIPPSIREIAEDCGISSTSTVVYHLDRLERQGAIRRIPGVARGIVLCEDGLPRLDGDALEDDDELDRVLKRRWTHD